MEKKYFFGWTNIKWVIRELVNIYSDKPSVFSKKRIESSVAFIAGISLVVGHAYTDWKTITNSEILADAVVLFGIAGYTVNKIQAEKKENPLVPDEPKKEDSAPIIDADSMKKSEDSI